VSLLEEMLYLGLGLIVFGFGGLLILWLITQANKKKPTCKYCGQQIKSSEYTRFSDGSTAHTECFQKVLDDQGVCPICNKPMHAGEDLYQDSGKWYHQICYLTSTYKKEGITPSQIAILENATRIFCGIPTKKEAVDNFVWAITDPMYGLYEKSLKKPGEISPETARVIIEKLFSRFPKSVTSFLKNYALHVPVTRMSINSLLTILQSEKLNKLKKNLETPNIWKCEYCGTINTGKFCSNCGAPRKAKGENP